jgi:thioredoxin-like negative regulator of GroEL
VLASTQPTGALLARGDQLWKEGKLEDAQQSFKTALLAEPRSTEIQMKLGGLQLSTNDFAASIQTYKNVILLDGRTVRPGWVCAFRICTRARAACRWPHLTKRSVWTPAKR